MVANQGIRKPFKITYMYMYVPSSNMKKQFNHLSLYYMYLLPNMAGLNQFLCISCIYSPNFPRRHVFNKGDLDVDSLPSLM